MGRTEGTIETVTERPHPREQPLWRQIAEKIERDIQQGVAAPGSALPTVLELAARFAVNRHTVRQALQSLQARGLISVEQGRGTFVRRPAFDYRLGRRVRFGDNFTEVEDTENILVGDMAAEPLSPKDAKRLKLPPDTLSWSFRTLRIVGGEPFSTSTHRLEHKRWPDFARVFKRCNCHFTRTLREFGMNDYLRLSTRLSAVLPTEEEQELLKVTASEPLFLSRGIDGLANTEPFHFVTTAFIGARIEFVFEPSL